MIKNRRIYRQAALERLLSPEQLDRLLRVSGPRNWAGLLAIYVFFAALLIWGTVADLPVVVQGVGVVVERGSVSDLQPRQSCGSASGPTQTAGAERELRIYLPATQSTGIQPGTLVQFRPLQPALHQSQFIMARVASVSDSAYPADRLEHVLQNSSQGKTVLEHAPAIELCAVFKTTVAAGRTMVSTGAAEIPMAALVPGTPGDAKLTVGTQKPIAVFVNSVRNKAGK